MYEANGKTYRTAIVHDWFCNMGGGDRVAESFLEVMPDSPIYTLCYLKKSLTERLRKADIRASFIQKMLNQKKDNHQKFLPLMPTAVESFNLNDYDIILSSSSSCAKGVISNPNSIHICYCHTPMRYAWEFFYEYTENISGIKLKIISIILTFIRMWDVISANRVDYFIANSQNVANRIRKHYRRNATVIYPPIDTDFFSVDESVKREDFYLCVSRLVKYKRIDLAVEACNKTRSRLVVIGQGAEIGYLKTIAGPTIRILGRQSDEVVRNYYQKCKALIFPGEEDFGMIPLEAQACGSPVIAYGKGGALETVIDGKTGVLFKEQTEDLLIDAINRIQSMNIEADDCRNNALQFSKDRFLAQMTRYISQCVTESVLSK